MSLTGQVIKVNLQNQVISASAPISLRSTASDFNAIDKLTDVSLAERTDGSTLVYNASNDKYEVKPLAAALPSLDGGTF